MLRVLTKAEELASRAESFGRLQEGMVFDLGRRRSFIAVRKRGRTVEVVELDRANIDRILRGTPCVHTRLRFECAFGRASDGDEHHQACTLRTSTGSAGRRSRAVSLSLSRSAQLARCGDAPNPRFARCVLDASDKSSIAPPRVLHVV